MGRRPSMVAFAWSAACCALWSCGGGGSAGSTPQVDGGGDVSPAGDDSGNSDSTAPDTGEDATGDSPTDRTLSDSPDDAPEERHTDSSAADATSSEAGSDAAADAADAQASDAADAQPDGADGGSDADAGCARGSQQCLDSMTIETCDADGGWGDPWPCQSGQCIGGACTQPTTTDAPSCAPGGDGMTSCGSGGNESCCTSLEIPGGSYVRNYLSDGGLPPPSILAEASVSGFRLDKYEVTVGRFRQFVDAVLPTDGGSGWVPANGSGKHAHLNGGQGLTNAGPSGGYEFGWSDTWDTYVTSGAGNLACDADATYTSTPGSNEKLPVNCLTWYAADAFCIWDGGFLPSEAEWEDAAAGGDERRAYPWGSTDPGTGNQYAIYGCLYPFLDDAGACMNRPNIAQVGHAAAGAGKWGQVDLAGNVYEWNLDLYYAQYPNYCWDCAYLNGPQSTLYRGGDFSSTTQYLSPTNREVLAANFPFGGVGFRCARTP